MIIRRLGNKKAIAKKIIPHFPKHRLYIEPFFGAGGMFFEKPLAKYNFVNDIDSDVYNVFDVIMHRFDELVQMVTLMPIHQKLLEHWQTNEETDPILKAIRFIFLSNYTLYGAGNTMRFTSSNSKKILLDMIWKVNKHMMHVQFACKDYREFLKAYSVKENEKGVTFIYCDPPYLHTGNNYAEGFSKQDSKDLFAALQATGCKWAMSEFDSPFILRQAQQLGLNVILIGERTNIKNKRTEILITNYQNKAGMFSYHDIKNNKHES